MRVVGFAVELDQLDVEFGAHVAHGALAEGEHGVGEHRPPVFGHEHQMGVQQRHAVSGTPIVGLGCHRWALQSGYADALPVPHRTDTGPAGDAGAGVRVLPGGVQRRAAGPRRGVSGRGQTVRQRDSAPRDHRGQDQQPSGPGCARCPVWRWCSRSTIRGGRGATSSTRPPGNARAARWVVRGSNRRRITGSRFGSPATDSASDPMAGCSWPRSARCGCAGRANCPANRQGSRSSANRMATSTPASSSTWRPHRCRRCTAKPGWMSGSPGWPRSPPATARASTSRIRSIWVASCANCGGWSGRSPAGRKDQPTGTSRGARSPSRTTRWPVLGGTITTSRLWRWFARTK